MKKNVLISSFLSMFLAIGCMPLSVSAAETDVSSISNTQIEYLEDNSYFEITINEDVNSSRAFTKSGAKTVTYKNSNGDVQWTYTINASFIYNPGISSTCSSVSDSYSISNNSWHISSHSCWKSGNTAYGTVTMQYKILGVTTQTVTRDISLSCDTNGNLS